jgi:site-specific DNA-methyltransferase (adenine-specific)
MFLIPFADDFYVLMKKYKVKAARNKTLTLTPEDIECLQTRCIQIEEPTGISQVLNKTIQGDTFEVLKFLPEGFVDLMVVDPPYNLTKSFNGSTFKKTSLEVYEEWLDGWMSQVCRLLKPTASVYICCDWQSSAAVHRIAAKYLMVRNRITWEREKGRGALSNWKNCSEDIWFCTVSEDYYFDVCAVKLKRKVLAPYRDESRQPKDWQAEKAGNFRITAPSNLWADISIPFWSMSENTDHPTQKPEKLLAKLILASSKPGDVVFDPFLGSGTTSVTAKKLDRQYVGIEQEPLYCCLTEKRLQKADDDRSIQGYAGGYFWDRNTLSDQHKIRSQEKLES